jgi:hypothetical protein
VPHALDPAELRGVKAAQPKKNKNKNKNIYLFYFILFIFIYFLGSGSLNPTELRGVKRVGKHEKHYSNNKSALGEVHELLIRCCIG